MAAVTGLDRAASDQVNVVSMAVCFELLVLAVFAGTALITVSAGEGGAGGDAGPPGSSGAPP